MTSFSLGVTPVRTITCNECGYAIGEDDFILCECPACDSFMDLNRLNKKVNPEFETIIRVDMTQRLKEKA